MPRNRKQIAAVADDQKRTTRLRWRRKALIVLLGTVVLSLIVGNTNWFEPDTLLKETVTVGDATYVCRIKNVKGDLQAEMSRKTFLWQTGDADSIHLGYVAEIGTKDPKIAFDPATGRIAFEVGGVKSLVRPGR